MNPKDQKTRRLLAEGFRKQFGSSKKTGLRVALAPGRVNLIGEHTDYNGGLVLPMGVDRHTAVVFQPNGLDRIRVYSDSIARTKGKQEAADEFGLTRSRIPRQKGVQQQWSNYVRGVAAALLKRGFKLKGGDLFITTDLPTGAGLSSSASLEVSTGLALQALAGNRRLKPQELALAAQEAEHTYAGVNCGIMDQSVVARAKPEHALLLDCQDLRVRHIPVRLKGWAFAIFDTGVRHELASSEYNKRRRECEAAARMCNVNTLRGITVDHLLAKADKLSPGQRRRVRHVMSEDQRTSNFAAELAAGNIPVLGRLLYGSHASLMQDYEVSCAELNFLVEQLVDEKLADVVAGARMTGGGFGGAIVALLKTTAFPSIQRKLKRSFQKAFSTPMGGSLLVQPSEGARVMRL